MKPINMLMLLSILVVIAACALPEPNKQNNPQTCTMCAGTNAMPNQGMGSMMGMHTNNEYEFIREMIPHHQEAVDTAKLTLQTTKNPELKILLNNIIVAQEKEIKMMNGWLNEWYPEQSTKSNYQPMMGNLEAVSGEQRDALFLNGMIMHHQMAIMMATQVLELKPRAEVKQLALGIVDSQSQEIGQMKTMSKQYNSTTCAANCPMMGHMMH